MDKEENQPGTGAAPPILLPEARWPRHSPLDSTAIGLAEQHAVLGITRFIAQQVLPKRYRDLFPGLIIPFAAWLLQHQRHLGRPMIVGLSGCQGAGKTTLALALQLILRESFDARTCYLSLDDFYLPQSTRQALARETAPLLATRGVPGTHDIPLLESTLDRLVSQDGSAQVALPVFDKGRDDRLPEESWPVVAAGPDIVILEGWCVGARGQTSAELAPPANRLEREEDPDRHWRSYVNERLESQYEPLFGRLDRLAFLQAPNWDAVFRWRANQEHKLIHHQGENYRAGLDTPEKLLRFISHYQRLTESMLADLPAQADVVFNLSEHQQFEATHINAQSEPRQ